MFQEIIKALVVLILANLAALAHWFFFMQTRFSFKQYILVLAVTDLVLAIGWLVYK